MPKKKRLLVAVPTLIIGLVLIYLIVTSELVMPGEQAYVSEPSTTNGSLIDDFIKAGIILATLVAYWYVLGAFIRSNLLKIILLIITVSFMLIASWVIGL